MLCCSKHSAIKEARDLRLKCGKRAPKLGEVLIYSVDYNISIRTVLLKTFGMEGKFYLLCLSY